jgi:hypothetical protein
MYINNCFLFIYCIILKHLYVIHISAEDVPSLLELSRVAVRASYPSGNDLPKRMATLNIPHSLQDYLNQYY